MTQKEKIIIKLREDGIVYRNWALERHITRLSAIIYNLREEGWEFDEGFTHDHKDYYYKVINEGKIPKRVKVEDIPSELISAGIVNVK